MSNLFNFWKQEFDIFHVSAFWFLFFFFTDVKRWRYKLIHHFFSLKFKNKWQTNFISNISNLTFRKFDFLRFFTRYTISSIFISLTLSIFCYTKEGYAKLRFRELLEKQINPMYSYVFWGKKLRIWINWIY